MLSLNIITGEAWKLCDTCGERIPTDSQCHDTKGFPSDPCAGMHRLGAEMARKREQLVLDVLLSERTA